MNLEDTEISCEIDLSNASLFIDSAHGVYIPQLFMQQIRNELLTGVTEEDRNTVLAGPDAEFYWEAWDMILQNAVVTDDMGKQFTLHHDEDLWLIPETAV